MGVKGEKTRRKNKTKVIRCAIFDGKDWKHGKQGRCPWDREEVRKDIKVCVGGHRSSYEAEFHNAAVGSWDL